MANNAINTDAQKRPLRSAFARRLWQTLSGKMIRHVCAKCKKEFPLADARVDEHWNKWSLEPAYAYCPYCDAKLERVLPSSVDFARHLKPKYIGLLVLWFVLWGLGIAAGQLNYVGPAMVGGFGLWMGMQAKVRDHRLIGWFLVVLAAGILYVVH